MPHAPIHRTPNSPPAGIAERTVETLIGDTRHLQRSPIERRSRMAIFVGAATISAFVNKDMSTALDAIAAGVAIISAPGALNSAINEVAVQISN